MPPEIDQFRSAFHSDLNRVCMNAADLGRGVAV